MLMMQRLKPSCNPQEVRTFGGAIRFGMIGRVAFCVLSWLGGVAAQNESFPVQTKVVQVPVSVIGKNGQNVDGLAAHDFRVLDDGVQQEVTVDDFSTGLPRISLAVAIQTSGISTPALTDIRRIGGM